MADKKKQGRPHQFNPEIHPEIILALWAAGKTDDRVSELVGITTTTLKRWRKVHPELSTAVKTKAAADQIVEDSLYARATGMEYEEVAFTSETRETPEGTTTVSRTVRTLKKLAPDPTSMIFWLKNRQPRRWREKHDLEPGDVIAVFNTLVGPTRNGGKGGNGSVKRIGGGKPSNGQTNSGES